MLCNLLFGDMKVIALVIGIDHYEHTEHFSVLNCAVNDAKSVAEEMAALKIDVETCLDEDEDTTMLYYDSFIRKIGTDLPHVAIFYFAGHGEMVNYQDSLILKNAKRSHLGETILLKHSLQVDTILKNMRAAGNQMNILILDACRTTSRGIAEPQEVKLKVPYQSFIAYSTSVGCGASDGVPGGHSPFAAALLKCLPTENMKVEDLFKQVRREMFANGRNQYSWDYSCLTDDYCFNHGQLNRHYGGKYDVTTYSLAKSYFTPIGCSSFIDNVTSGDSKRIDMAMHQLVANKNKYDKNELFVMGRAMLRACKYSAARKYINITKLSLLAIGNDNPFIDGLLYEMFFDEEDLCRKKKIMGVEILDDVAKVCDSKTFASSVSFIQKELEPFRGEVSFIPGTDVHVVRINLESSDVLQREDKRIWLITDVEYEDENIQDLIAGTAYSISDLRERVKTFLRIPYRNLKIRVTENISPDDVLIVHDLGYVDAFIYDYYQNHVPDEFDELGHHYELSDVEDCSVLDMEAMDGMLIVSGSFTLSVVAYLDSEEEVEDDVSLDGEFKISLEFNENHWTVIDYDYMKLNKV